MPVEIRPLAPADQRSWFQAVSASFGEVLNEEQMATDQRLLDPERILGAYDGDAVVGGGGAFSFKMTVPGGRQLPTGGVTSVGVMPTHRRQGMLRQLMARQLDDIKKRGEPFATLWASEGSIYQRFGYGLASLNGTVEVDRERARFREPVEEVGTVRLVDAAEATRLAPAIYAAVAAETPGFFTRDATWWDVFMSDPEFRRRGAGQKFYVIHERDGEAVGYATYRIKSEWLDTGSASVLMVIEAIAVDASATQQLWRYLFGVDLIAKIRARLGPPDHPLLIMVAEPRRLSLRVGDGLWLRIVDLPAALEGRGYTADGSVVIEVSDEFMPAVAGRWRLTSAEGRGRVEATTDEADITLDISDLGALYLGAFTFADMSRAARTVELTPGAWARADVMLATRIKPWCPEVF